MNELSSRIEVYAHVKVGGVVGLDAMVGDVHPSVTLCSSTPLALCTVQDVSDAKFDQFTSI